VVLVSGTTFAVTLPTTIGNTGKLIRVQKVDSGFVTPISVKGATTAHTIGGAAGVTLQIQYESFDFVADGMTGWDVTGHVVPAVGAAYYCNANTTASGTTYINFNTKEFDTHNAVTTGGSWIFTAPANGFYNLSGYLNVTAASANQVLLFKNGATYKTVGNLGTVGDCEISNMIQLSGLDTIALRPTAAFTFSGGTLWAANTSNFSIQLVSKN
jgi:hypothetical protein